MIKQIKKYYILFFYSICINTSYVSHTYQLSEGPDFPNKVWEHLQWPYILFGVSLQSSLLNLFENMFRIQFAADSYF